MNLRLRAHALHALLAGAMLVGCAAPPRPAQPIELRQATADSSIIYFLRPSADSVNSRDNPTLSVDGRSVGILGFASYAAVDLAPGKHRVALAAGATDSKDWNVAADFETKSGTTYYVAIWHQRQPQSAPAFMSAYGPVGELVFQILNQPTGERGVRFEQIPRDIAEFAASGLRAVPSATSASAARPQ